MSRQHSGFTLIELIIVIVILGALAVVALPRFIDLQDEADQAAAEGVAGNLGSGSAINLSATLAGSPDATDVTECGDTSKTLNDGQLPDGYSFVDTGESLGSSNGDSTDCLVGNGNGTATFKGIYAATP